jgi:hypothetical protein
VDGTKLFSKLVEASGLAAVAMSENDKAISTVVR